MNKMLFYKSIVFFVMMLNFTNAISMEAAKKIEEWTYGIEQGEQFNVHTWYHYGKVVPRWTNEEPHKPMEAAAREGGSNKGKNKRPHTLSATDVSLSDEETAEAVAGTAQRRRINHADAERMNLLLKQCAGRPNAVIDVVLDSRYKLTRALSFLRTGQFKDAYRLCWLTALKCSGITRQKAALLEALPLKLVENREEDSLIKLVIPLCISEKVEELDAAYRRVYGLCSGRLHCIQVLRMHLSATPNITQLTRLADFIKLLNFSRVSFPDLICFTSMSTPAKQAKNEALVAFLDSIGDGLTEAQFLKAMNLIVEGADINALSKTGETLLHKVINAEALLPLYILLQFSNLNIGLPNASGLVPLEMAKRVDFFRHEKVEQARLRSAEMVKYLMRRKDLPEAPEHVRNCEKCDGIYCIR